MSTPAVLIVDDDVKITRLLQSYFAEAGFAVFVAADGVEALRQSRLVQPDIVILDLMLPGSDGWDVCRQLRLESDVPILMLTARDGESDRLSGLEMGADDYVVKPFSPREVVARAKVILRRTQKQSPNDGPRTVIAGLTLDTAAHTLSRDGLAIDLTPTEFNILELLAASPGRVFSRLQMVEAVQGYAFEGYERTIDAHIKNLRRKIGENPREPRLIQTVYGVGYKFTGDSHA
ncbi:MAG TPA: response regulator transcription factor [Patescibacteria group bacterium]|nr:response regulator transcription factor [Patescibacteria group bacterium]